MTTHHVAYFGVERPTDSGTTFVKPPPARANNWFTVDRPTDVGGTVYVLPPAEPDNNTHVTGDPDQT